MNTEQTILTKQKVVTTAAMLALIITLALGVKVLPNKQPGQATISRPTSNSSSASSSPSANITYKDGTYMATGTYDSPGGTQSIEVSLSIAANTVTNAVVTGNSNSGVTQIYQSDFISGYKQFVVGKKLRDIRVSRVSGSSLTSNGFNEALKHIEAQAKV